MNKQEAYDFLTQSGVKFEITEHQAVYNMAELAQIDNPHPECDAKNLFVRDDKRRQYYLITVKGDKRVDLKSVPQSSWHTPSDLCLRKRAYGHNGSYPGSCYSSGAA